MLSKLISKLALNGYRFSIHKVDYEHKELNDLNIIKLGIAKDGHFKEILFYPKVWEDEEYICIQINELINKLKLNE